MDADVERLARKTLAQLEAKPLGYRLIVGISGVPGAGKTTLADAVALRINVIDHEQHDHDDNSGSSEAAPLAVALPMDGFHYSRAHLASMSNPEEAIHRRGAAFTFDAEGFLELVQKLRNAPTTGDEAVIIRAPSFGHEIKDPVADSVAIAPESRIVLIEGNYCALNRDPWKQAAQLMDSLWYVDTPADVAVERLAKRHLASGIVADEKEALDRAKGTDGMNASDVRQNLLPVDEVIKVA